MLTLTTPLVKPEIPATYFAPKEDIELAVRQGLVRMLADHPQSPLTPGITGFGGNMSAPFVSMPSFNEAQIDNYLNHMRNMHTSPGPIHRRQQQHNSTMFLAPPSMGSSRLSLSPRATSSCGNTSNTSGYRSINSSNNSLEQLCSQNVSQNMSQNLSQNMSQNLSSASVSPSGRYSTDSSSFKSSSTPLSSIQRRLSDSADSQMFECDSRTTMNSYGLSVIYPNFLFSTTKKFINI